MASLLDLAKFTNLSEDMEIIVNMKNYDFYEPAFVLGVLSLHKSGIIKVDPTWWKNEDYLARINMHKHLWIEEPCVNRKNCPTLVEITQITENTTWSETDEIARKIMINAWIEYKVENNNVFWALQWIFRELVDNSIKHSKWDLLLWGCYFMVQYYKWKDEIQISIVDNWIWIKESFRWSAHWKEWEWDEYYIDLAFQRWITSDSSIWAGNWLAFTKMIVEKTNSSMSYVSWKTLFTVDKWEEYFTRGNIWWKGVLLDIHLNLNILQESDTIEWLRKEWKWSSFTDLVLDDMEYDSYSDIFW